MLNIAEQCELLDISRSSYYYKCQSKNEERDMEILKAIIIVLNKYPFYGYRKIAKELNDMDVSRKQIRRIMHRAGLKAIFPGKNLSKPGKNHEIYPYLLKNKTIWLPNQVWATDITYIKLKGGHVYLTAIIDIFSRKVLTWKLSNTLDSEFCISALEEAISVYGIPAIFNTDQGSQFTSRAFISVLEEYGIQISMDSKGRALDNIYIERLWRSLKYEEIFLNEYNSMDELKVAIKNYFKFYNIKRFHQSLDYETPDEIYYQAFNNSVYSWAA